VRRFLFTLLLLAVAAVSNAGEGKLQYEFDAWEGPPLRVFMTHPPGLSPERPVVMVMHGMQRNADDYRDQWHELAIEHNFLLVVPEFSNTDYPRSRGYNLGNMMDGDNQPVEPSLWTFTAVEKVFDDVRKRFSMNAEQYALYGHSAGSQFVHRFLMYMPGARVSSVVVANAGWYTLPDFSVEFPYGLKGSTVTQQNLAGFLGIPLTILLGDQDTDPDDENLRRSKQALLQGPHRLARGYYFFASGRRAAAQLQVQFNWKLAEVHGADHDNRKMAPSAVQFLLND